MFETATARFLVFRLKVLFAASTYTVWENMEN